MKMVTVQVIVWTLIAIVAVFLALMLLLAITVAVVVVLLAAIFLLPFEGVLRLMSLVSPAASRWTETLYGKLESWLRRIRPEA
jgi:hypothetical protein